MAIAPLMYRATGHAGAALSLPVQITNLNQAPVRLILTVHAVTYDDWSYAPELDKASPFDCSTWFPVKQYTETLEANGQLTIPLKCDVPKGIAPGIYYCLGTIDPQVNANDPNQIRPEYTIPIIVRVGTLPRPQLQFGQPILTIGKTNSAVDMPFINDGNEFAIIGASIQIRDATGRAVASGIDPDHNLYPQSKRSLTLTVPSRLPDGQYHVQVTCQVNLQTFRPITAAFVVSKGKAVPATAASMISLPPFTIDPPVFHQKIPIGGTKFQAVKFINQTDQPVTVEISARKLTQSTNGLFQVLDDTVGAPLSLKVNPSTLVLPGHGSANALVLMSVGPNASGDLWFALSAISTAKDSLSQEAYASIVVPGTESPKLTITQRALNKVGGIPISVDYDVTNTGNVALLPKISASVLESGLTPVYKLEVPQLGDGGIIPGATLSNRVMLPPNIKPGAYTIRLEYQYAETKDLQPISEVKIIPLIVPVSTNSKSGGHG